MFIVRNIFYDFPISIYFKFCLGNRDKSGSVDFENFVTVACRQNDSRFEFDIKQFCHNLFLDIDLNGDGQINMKEFKEANELLPGIIKLFKDNHTGRISKKEFQVLFQSRLTFSEREMELFVSVFLYFLFLNLC